MAKSADVRLVARCVVCKGDIYGNEAYEQWEGGYYCKRHSLPYLRARAEEYRKLLQGETEVRR